MKKTIALLLSLVMLATLIPFFSIGITAEAAESTEYLSETFGTPSEVPSQDLVKSATEGYNNWRVTFGNYADAKADGVEFLIIPEDDQNNVLHLKRDTYGSTKPQLVAGKKVTGVPGTDSVKISWRMKYLESTHAVAWDGVFNYFGQSKVQMANGHTFTPVGAEQLAALNTKNFWHTYEIVVSYTLGTTTLYVDSMQIGEVCDSTFTLSQISFYLPRANSDSVGDVYIDDLKVVHIPDQDWVTMSEILNGQEAGHITKNLNLMTTKNDYTVAWTSSKPAVISTSGVVTRPSFFDEKVTLMAKVTMTATGAYVGTNIFDLVVPCSGDVIWHETFGTPQTVAKRDLTTSKTEGYNDWRITYIHPDYNFEQSKADGVEFLIIPEDDQNNVLHLKRDTYGSTKPQLSVGKNLTGVPGTDSVKLSWQMKYSNSTHNVVWDSVFNVIGHNKVQLANGHEFAPVGAEQIAALNTKDVWHIYELVINYTLGTTTLYVDNIQIGAAGNSTFALSKIDLLLPRHIKESVGNVYIDNLKVVHIPDPELVTTAEILNGQEAGHITKNLNLMTTKDDYTIAWTSSKPAVISTTGVVTRSSVLDEKVTLTANVSLTATGASVKTYIFDVVVPCSGDVIWHETFGTPQTVAKRDLTTSKTEGYNDWRITFIHPDYNFEQSKADGVEFLIIPEDDQNNVLRLKRDTYGSTKPQLSVGKNLTGIPGTDSVKLSWQMKYSNSTHNVVWDSVFNVIGHNKVQLANGHEFAPVGAEQIAALNTKDVWHIYELVINYTLGTTTLYVDNMQIGEAANYTIPLTKVDFLLPRTNSNSVGNVYIDNLKVVHIPDPELVTTAEILNGQEAGHITKNLNLMTTKDIYTIAWTSSKPAVISTTGVVTRPSVFDEKVTLTANISLTATGASVGTCVFNVVVPCSGDVIWHETFGTPQTVQEQPLATSKTEGYGDWRVTFGDYTEAKAGGVGFQIVPEDNNNVLHLKRESYGTDKPQLVVSKQVTGVPETDSVKISWQMKYSNTTHALMWDGVFSVIGHNKVQLAKGHTFTPVGAEQIAALNTKDVWHIYEVVINYTLGTTTLYVDNIQIGDVYNDTFTLAKIDLLLPRNNKDSVGNVYIDNLKVGTLTEPYNKYHVQKLYFGKNDAFTDAPIKGGELSKIILQKKAEADGNTTVITAFYNAEGALKGIKVTPVTSSDFNASGVAELDIKMKLPAKDSDIIGGHTKVLIWSDMQNIVPIEKPFVDTSSAGIPKVYVIGDSVSAHYNENMFPRAGLGQMLPGYFNTIEIDNCASSGKHTEDYLLYSKWNYIVENVKEGDYVIIELGVNDMHYNIPIATTKKNLTTMANTFLNKGVNVMILTPAMKRAFKNGKLAVEFDENRNFVTTDFFTTSSGDYYNAIKEVIEENEDRLGFHSIDLTALTSEEIGPDATDATNDPSIRYYMQDVYYNWDNYDDDSRAANSVFADKNSQYYKEVVSDDTHLTLFGADVFSQKIAQTIYDMNLPISEYVVNLDRVITYPNTQYTYPQ